MKLRTNPKRTEKALDSNIKGSSRTTISTPVQPSKVTKTPSKPSVADSSNKTTPIPGVTGPRPRGRPRLSALPTTTTTTTTTLTPKTPVSTKSTKSKADATATASATATVREGKGEKDDLDHEVDNKTAVTPSIKTEEKDDHDEKGKDEVNSASTPTASTDKETGAKSKKDGASTTVTAASKTKTPAPASKAPTTSSESLSTSTSATASTSTRSKSTAIKSTLASTTKAESPETEKEKTKNTTSSESSKSSKADEPVPVAAPESVSVPASAPGPAPSSSSGSKSSPSPVKTRGSSQSKTIASASTISSKTDVSDKGTPTPTSAEPETVPVPDPVEQQTAPTKSDAAEQPEKDKVKDTEKEKDKSSSDETSESKATTTTTSAASVSVASATSSSASESSSSTTITEKELEEAQESAGVDASPAEPVVETSVTAESLLNEGKQLVLKLDKIATPEVPALKSTPTPVQPIKRSERASTVLKRKLSEDAPVRVSTGKRGRPPNKNKVQPGATTSTTTAATPASKDKDKDKDSDAKSSLKEDKNKEKDKDKDKDTDMETTKDKDKDKGKDKEREFERFYSEIKETSVVSERWSFGGVLWDPTKKMKVMAASEVDVTSNGNMRLRRCIQVFEDRTVRIMVEGADMTKTFSTTGEVDDANEVTQLIHKVATSKICTGIKNFGTTDKIYFPHCILRGESYFAPECPIVIDYGVVGPLCQHCNRLRNMIQRRNVKETNLLYSKFSRGPVKNIRSGFGKQLYSMLTDLVEASSVDAKKERKKLRRMIPSNAKEYPFRSDFSKISANLMDGLTLDENHQMQLHQQQQQLQLQLAQQQLHIHQQQQLQQFIKSDSSGNITISSIPGNTIVTPVTGSSDYIRLAKPFMGQNTSEMMTFNVMPGQRGSFKVARDSGGQLTAVSTAGGSFTGALSGGAVLTPSEMHMVEQLVLQEGHDVGNVIIQNSGDFTLAEGQEYELIGEADSDNPIQVLEVLKEENQANNTIEIIEVDDQTLAQLTSQNLGNFIIQEPSSGFEVQEIDANDPNFRHLVKALNPGTVVYQS